ncbi:zinc finger and SCAN domain-containing protein 21-like [Hippocampus comes]|uniref:zinc finger and SCAN domain-containing protein 21-like n=1 Tax=Hippocampus comes TaxID=109280 RepID=UPI00094EF479|nr:PREDICTED: zinc finger and SCAN domain-containing protein 21-like [Hippocampus comes]
MCQVELLRALLNQRLSAAVDEVFGVVARTIAEYQEELCRSKEENERQRQLLDAVLKPHVVLYKEESSSQECLSPKQQEGISTVEPRQPEPPRIKEEEEKADVTQLPLVAFPLRVDAEAEEEGDGDRCGASQAASLSAPLSDLDDITLHSFDTDGDKHSKSDMTGRTAGKRWKCSQCGRTFDYSSALIKHIRTHTGEKPFKCSVCGKSFTHKGNLTAHTRTHTGEKPYGCSICNKSFTGHSALTKHTRIHTGEKPFRCSVCGKRYTQNETLKAHSRTHTGEKPYSCLVCHKRFSSHSSFARHRRTHSDEKPYSCLVCNRSFRSNSAFARHRKKTHWRQSVQLRRVQEDIPSQVPSEDTQVRCTQ